MNSHAEKALIPLMAVLTAITAQLRIMIGPIPYTLQNTAVVLTGLLLSPRGAFYSMLIYIMLIGLGLPLASGFRGGLPVLFGYTAGYLWGFLVSAPIVSILTRAFLRKSGKDLTRLSAADKAALVILSALGMLPTYLLGFAVFAYYAIPGSPLYEWSLSSLGYLGIDADGWLLAFAASVLIFLPEDLLIDHPLAVLIASGLYRQLVERGFGDGRSSSIRRDL